MAQFQKKHLKKIIYSPIALVVLAVIVSFALYGVIDIVPKYNDARDVKQRILNKRAELQLRQEHLENELIGLETDQGVQDAIREKLNVVKEGEHVIMIVDPKAEPIDESVQPKKSWWQRLFE